MRIVLFILSLTFVWPQTVSTGIAGFGEIQLIHDASSAGLGRSQFFSTQSNGYTLNSASSLWKTKNVKIGFSTTFSKFSNNSGIELKSNILNDMFFTTPLGENQALSFGLIPHTRSNFFIKTSPADGERVNFNGKIYTPAYTYHSSGGISRFFVSYSKLFDKGFSAGITWYKNFGNLFLSDSVQTYQVFTSSETGLTTYSLNDISSSYRTHNFSGNSFTVEGRVEENRHAFVVSTYWQSVLRIRTHYLSVAGNGNSTKDIYRSEGISFSGIGGGVLYKPDDLTGFTGEIHYLNPTETAADLFGISEKKLVSLNSGVFHRFENQKLGVWNSINVSTGFYAVYHKYSIGVLTDYGLTLGFGIEYLNQKNVVNIVLSAGKRSGLFDSLSDENYINLKVGITTGEHWFVKRRRN